jgi:oxygen-independent coproporphyrinogen-3 oxidase
LSIGVQSFAAEELKALGRLHTAEEAKESVRLARAAGFDRISIDLMYGIPHQTLDSFAYSLREAVSLHPEHISAYALKIEEGTPFYKSQEDLPLPDEDTEVAMYDLCHDILSQNGYTQYEVSNYALQGEESRHNLRYWRSAEYIGVGVSAYSYFGGYRYGNDRDLTAYLTRDFSYLPHGERIDKSEEEYEMIMLSLRLKEGLSHADFALRFGKSSTETYGIALAPFIRAGLVIQDEAHTALTHKGMYVMNYILTAILS